MYGLASVIVVLTFVSATLQQSIQTGVCDNIPTVPGFNTSLFMGTWYQIQRIPNLWELHECTVIQLMLTPNVPTNHLGSFVQTEVASNNNRTTWSGSFSTNGLGTFVINNQYTVSVLASDYSGYALLHLCQNRTGGQKAVYSWKWSRARSLSAIQTQTINTIVNNTPELRNVTNWRTTAQTCSGSHIITPTILTILAAYLLAVKY